MPESRDPQLDELRRRARRRLVGAVVLALAAAVLVPMLLESDPKPLGEDVAVKIPPIDEGKFVSKVGDKGKAAEPAPKPEPRAPAKAEAAAPPAPAVAEVAKDAPAAPAEVAKDAAGASAASPAKALASAEQKVLAPTQKAAPALAPAPSSVKSAPPSAKESAPPPAKEAAPPPKGEPAARPAEADKAGAFAVQLAAFIDDKGANALAGKLKKAGYPAYTEPYETSRGTLWRVRVGPYPSRDAAEGVRTKLKGEGQNGIIAAAK